MAIIYQPAKSAMQAGRHRDKCWLLTYNSSVVSSNNSLDTEKSINIKFSTLERAIEFAKNNKIEYEVIMPKQKKIVIKSYADSLGG